ncbi:MAG: DUF2442 domain-containing protein [Chitinophagaceae bacterium]|nr:DUF2442 domain-containing protein [Chitinophagaceae bacterium]
MNTVLTYPSIKAVEFINSSIMFVHLDNDRTFIVPLEKFPAIQKLSADEKYAFEIIDDQNLSFLSIDEIYSIKELIGLSAP